MDPDTPLTDTPVTADVCSDVDNMVDDNEDILFKLSIPVGGNENVRSTVCSSLHGPFQSRNIWFQTKLTGFTVVADSLKDLKVSIVFTMTSGSEYQLGLYEGPLGVAEKKFTSEIGAAGTKVSVDRCLRLYNQDS